LAPIHQMKSMKLFIIIVAAVESARLGAAVPKPQVVHASPHSTLPTKVKSDELDFLKHNAAKATVAKPPPHVLVHTSAASQGLSAADIALGTENRAETQLLHFLSAENDLSKQNELPPFDEYLPACMDHLHTLVEDLDKGYTDLQLQKVLTDECWLNKEFPESYEDSFENEAACKKFGKDLVAARHLELDEGSQEGYEGFCADYYVHKGGKIEKAKKKAEAKKEEAIPPPPPVGSLPWMYLTVGVTIIIACYGVSFMISKNKPLHPGKTFA